MPLNDQLLETLLWEDEGTSLDFKSQQYRFENAGERDKSELLKDVLAFANSWRRMKAYILIGVEEVRGGRSKIVGVSQHLDDAILHQFVNSKTQRPVEFSYGQFSIEDKSIGYIEILLQERPIYLTSKYGPLKAKAVKIRDGSSTRDATPDEVKKMGMEQVLGSKAGTEPEVAVFLKRDSRRNRAIYLALKNVGQGPAKNVMFTIRANRADFESHQVSSILPIDTTVKAAGFLLQGESIESFFGISPTLSEHPQLQPFEVLVTYEDLKGTPREATYVLDVAQHNWISWITEMSGGTL